MDSLTLWPPAAYSLCVCFVCVVFAYHVSVSCASDSASHLYILPLSVSRPFFFAHLFRVLC